MFIDRNLVTDGSGKYKNNINFFCREELLKMVAERSLPSNCLSHILQRQFNRLYTRML